MNKIEVYRTHVEIRDYDMGQCPYIEKQFSIYDKLYFRYYPKAMYYDSVNRILMLPRRIDVFRLEKFYNEVAAINTECDPIRYIEPIELKYAPRDEDQKEAIRFMLSIDHWKNNSNHTMLALNLNTGKGKSYCTIASIAYKGMTSAIIADTMGCLDQWKNYFLQYTDVTTEQICDVSGSPSIIKLFTLDHTKYKVFLMSHGTLQSYASIHGWNKIHELFIHLGIGIKIYDEAHKSFDNMMLIDSYTNTYLTYYLTATLGRSSREENAIFQRYFFGVPSIELFHEDTDPHTAYVGIKFNSRPSAMDVSHCYNNYGLNRSNYTNYVVKQPNFENLLYILMEKALAKPGKCLWYVGTNDAILYIRDWIYEHYPEMVRQVGIYTTLTPKEEKKEQLNRKIILSTTKSAGAAMDIKGLVETVNLAEPFKSKVLAQQTFGRTRGDDTIYKDIVDMGFPQTRAYYNLKKPVFTKYATSCKEVILKDQQLQQLADEIRNRRSCYIYPLTFEDDRKN